jgi:hypothetical protein
MRMSRAVVLLVLAMAPGCGSSHPTSPLTPSTGASQVQVQQQSVAGYVGDTAFRSVAGARVEVLDGPQAGMVLTTDGNGQFSYAGTFATAVTLRASKDGYIALTKTTQTSTPGGRPWVYFQLEVLGPPVNIAGDYTLTFIAGDACTGLPNELRTRSYAATIAPRSNPLTRPDTSFTLTAGGARFFDAFNQFPIGVAADYAAFMVYNGEDFGLVEQIAPKEYLGFYGEARASVGASPVSTISMTFDGVIDYCALTSDSGWNYTCSSSLAIAHASCKSKNHRLTLTRR